MQWKATAKQMHKAVPDSVFHQGVCHTEDFIALGSRTGAPFDVDIVDKQSAIKASHAFKDIQQVQATRANQKVALDESVLTMRQVLHCQRSTKADKRGSFASPAVNLPGAHSRHSLSLGQQRVQACLQLQNGNSGYVTVLVQQQETITTKRASHVNGLVMGLSHAEIDWISYQLGIDSATCFSNLLSPRRKF